MPVPKVVKGGLLVAFAACASPESANRITASVPIHEQALADEVDVLTLPRPLLPGTYGYLIARAPTQPRARLGLGALSSSEVAAEIDRAVDAWDAALPGVSFKRVQEVSQAEILFRFVPIPRDTLAATSVVCARVLPGGACADSIRLIRINNNRAWYAADDVEALLRRGDTMPDKSGLVKGYGLQLVATHEFGHALGLDHWQAGSLPCYVDGAIPPACVTPPVMAHVTDQAVPFALWCEDLSMLASVYSAAGVDTGKCAKRMLQASPSIASVPPSTTVPPHLNPTVRVVDTQQNPVAGATVVFHSASGTVTGSVQTTDAQGLAAVGAWRVGPTVGPQALTASIYGAGVKAATCAPRSSGTPCQPVIGFRHEVTFTAQVGSSSPVATIMAGGGAITCALKVSGARSCWGSNHAGTFGNGTTSPQLSPTLIVGGPPFVQLVGGDNHVCGRTAGNAVYCWGLNYRGQLGDGTNTDRPSPVLSAGGMPFVDIAAGSEHTCGVTAANAAYCWGRNDSGQLGDSTVGHSPTPRLVGGGLAFTKLAAGMAHTCGRTSSNATYCWGGNLYGQVGDGTTTPQAAPALVAGGHAFVALSAGVFHTCGSTASGMVYCWGYNVYGQLGDGTTQNRLSPAPVQGGHAFVQIDAGRYYSSCGRTSGGVLYCWGYNAWGQLGDGTTTDRWVPTAVSGGHSLVDFAHGGSYACGQTTSNVILCWGNNGGGQLGDGTQTDRYSPGPTSPIP